jgi:hypothetical protein
MKPVVSITTGAINSWAQKTIDYMNSELGKANWKANEGRGYSPNMNLVAAVQTAARLVIYEHITAVIDVLNHEQAVKKLTA